MQFTTTLVAIVAAMTTAVSANPTPQYDQKNCPGATSYTTGSGTKQSFWVLKNTDFYGNDVQVTPLGPGDRFPFRTDGAHACMELCTRYNNTKKKADPECTHITWNTVNKNCYLKRTGSGCGTRASNGISGILKR